MKPNILVSNDDGIDAPGLETLVTELKKFSNVFVSAPHRQQSAVGHAITLYYPLRAREHFKQGEYFGMAVEGTPADAVKLGVLVLFKNIKMDMVISGINHGANTSVNVIYSGTVSAATEGTTLNIPSAAISLTTFSKIDFNDAAKVSASIIKDILIDQKIKLTPKTLLNINIPAVPVNEIKGVKITKQGAKSYWEDSFEVRSDPNGREYYWLTGHMEIHDTDEIYDIVAIRDNYVSITPLHYDLTDTCKFEEIKDVKFEIKKG
jgi:5'-nucleotidase